MPERREPGEFFLKPAPLELVIASSLEDVHHELSRGRVKKVPLEVEIRSQTEQSGVVVDHLDVVTSQKSHHKGRERVFKIEGAFRRVGNFKAQDLGAMEESLSLTGLHLARAPQSLVCWVEDRDHLGAAQISPQRGTNILLVDLRRKTRHDRRRYPYLGSPQEFRNRIVTFQKIASQVISNLPARR